MEDSSPYLVSPAREGRNPAGNNRFQTFHHVVPWTADLIGSAKLWRQPEYGSVFIVNHRWVGNYRGLRFKESRGGRDSRYQSCQRRSNIDQHSATSPINVSPVVDDIRRTFSNKAIRTVRWDGYCCDGMAAAAVLWQTRPRQTAVDEKCTLLNGLRPLDDRWCAFSHSANEFR